MSYSVYKITNLSNGKYYIGKTIDVVSRWTQHCRDSRAGSQLPIHRAIRKYGIAAFKIDVLEEFSTDDQACHREKDLIQTAHAQQKSQCYNIAEGGLGGRTMTDAQIRAQYVIPLERNSEFEQLVNEGVSVSQMMARYDASRNAVINRAKMLHVSFSKNADVVAIPYSSDEEFLTLVNAGKSRRELQEHFNVSKHSVVSCAKRLGVLSSIQRRKRCIEKLHKKEIVQISSTESLTKITNQSQRTDRRSKSKTYSQIPSKKKVCLSDQERSELRRQVMIRVNKSRGILDETRSKVIDMYVHHHMTAKEIAARLNISTGSVRSTVNSYYASLPPDERERLKHEHGSAVRTGVRNPSAQRCLKRF